MRYEFQSERAGRPRAPEIEALGGTIAQAERALAGAVAAAQAT